MISLFLFFCDDDWYTIFDSLPIGCKNMGTDPTWFFQVADGKEWQKIQQTTAVFEPK